MFSMKYLRWLDCMLDTSLPLPNLSTIKIRSRRDNLTRKFVLACLKRFCTNQTVQPTNIKCAKKHVNFFHEKITRIHNGFPSTNPLTYSFILMNNDPFLLVKLSHCWRGVQMISVRLIPCHHGLSRSARTYLLIK